MTEKVKAAIDVVDKVCAELNGTRKDHVIVQEAIRIIREAVEPGTDKEKIEVPKGALPRDRKKKIKVKR